MKNLNETPDAIVIIVLREKNNPKVKYFIEI